MCFLAPFAHSTCRQGQTPQGKGLGSRTSGSCKHQETPLLLAHKLHVRAPQSFSQVTRRTREKGLQPYRKGIARSPGGDLCGQWTPSRLLPAGTSPQKGSLEALQTLFSQRPRHTGMMGVRTATGKCTERRWRSAARLRGQSLCLSTSPSRQRRDSGIPTVG